MISIYSKFLINRRHYLEAFEMMKKQRINLNLLCDHQPQEFLVGCDAFVRQISLIDVANLNLFLGELQYVGVFHFTWCCDTSPERHSPPEGANISPPHTVPHKQWPQTKAT